MGKECVKDTSSGWDALTDIPGMIVGAISSFLGTLIEQIMKPLRECLADTLLATPDVTQHADIKRLWKAMLGITAGIYVLLVTAGGITVMGYETIQSRYALKQILPRLLVGMVAAATSLTVMGKAIGLANALAHAIMATDLADAGQGMVERILPFALFGAAGLKLYLIILAIAVIALVLAVMIGFTVRVAVMALLAVCAPLALACHAHPVTDPVARLWWRALAGCLIIQVAQSVTFVLALKLFFAPGASTLGIPKSDQLGTLLAGLGLFWVLFKIPGWALQVILRGTPVHQPHAPAALRVLKHLALYRLMDHYLPATRLLRRRNSGTGGSGGGGGFGQGRGGPGGRHGGPGGGGRGGSRPPTPGPGRGGSTRSRAGRPTAPPGAPDSRGATGSSEAGGAQRTAPSGERNATPASATAPGLTSRRASVGQVPRRPGPRAAPFARASNGPRTVLHPTQTRRRQQLTVPIPTERTPAQPSHPTQASLPVRTADTPTSLLPRPDRTSPSLRTGSTTTPPLPTRQPVRPIPTAPKRPRPVRPMQLQLPLEPPRR
ncbi:hypothetical protein [Streptomyces noursei]|uniref:hypothetical protein n=1 Tax=Streptomyces noursei TaxID=1971 RepID=UPI00167265B2|nr:hypothetical protein [Streptomyces noursei]MCZ1014799.1 hypothetical protein [Streptomyces noursei]GGW97752.1 hypothetical protein GCM10010341_19090 [Streptomyces noursei]